MEKARLEDLLAQHPSPPSKTVLPVKPVAEKNRKSPWPILHTVRQQMCETVCYQVCIRHGTIACLDLQKRYPYILKLQQANTFIIHARNIQKCALCTPKTKKCEMPSCFHFSSR